MLRKLRTKFVFIMMIIFIMMLILVFAFIVHFTHKNYVDNCTEQMRSVVVEPFVPDRPDGLRGSSPFPHFVITASRTGHLISSSGDEYFDLSDKAFLQELLDIALDSPKPDGLIREHKLRYLSVSSYSGFTRVVFMDSSPEFSAMKRLVTLLLIIGVSSVALFWGISMYLANFLVKPVERAWEQQRQFVADASHELKTPLTVMTTNAELLNTDGFSEHEKTGFSENILAMAKQMRQLVDGLLELAKADSGSLQMNMKKFSISRMLSDAVLPFEPLFFENSMTLDYDIQPDITVNGSEEHLRQLLEILLDNAMKYSDPGSTVHLKLERQGFCALLSVANSGPAISQYDLENIFKRFYRADKARGGGSYGLGLAIAESIVEYHNGKIWAESSNGINSFWIRLPF